MLLWGSSSSGNNSSSSVPSSSSIPGMSAGAGRLSRANSRLAIIEEREEQDQSFRQQQTEHPPLHPHRLSGTTLPGGVGNDVENGLPPRRKSHQDTAPPSSSSVGGGRSSSPPRTNTITVTNSSSGGGSHGTRSNTRTTTGNTNSSSTDRKEKFMSSNSYLMGQVQGGQGQQQSSDIPEIPSEDPYSHLNQQDFSTISVYPGGMHVPTTTGPSGLLTGPIHYPNNHNDTETSYNRHPFPGQAPSTPKAMGTGTGSPSARRNSGRGLSALGFGLGLGLGGGNTPNGSGSNGQGSFFFIYDHLIASNSLLSKHYQTYRKSEFSFITLLIYVFIITTFLIILTIQAKRELPQEKGPIILILLCILTMIIGCIMVIAMYYFCFVKIFLISNNNSVSGRTNVTGNTKSTGDTDNSLTPRAKTVFGAWWMSCSWLFSCFCPSYAKQASYPTQLRNWSWLGLKRRFKKAKCSTVGSNGTASSGIGGGNGVGGVRYSWGTTVGDNSLNEDDSNSFLPGYSTHGQRNKFTFLGDDSLEESFDEDGLEEDEHFQHGESGMSGPSTSKGLLSSMLARGNSMTYHTTSTAAPSVLHTSSRDSGNGNGGNHNNSDRSKEVEHGEKRLARIIKTYSANSLDQPIQSGMRDFSMKPGVNGGPGPLVSTPSGIVSPNHHKLEQTTTATGANTNTASNPSVKPTMPASQSSTTYLHQHENHRHRSSSSAEESIVANVPKWMDRVQMFWIFLLTVTLLFYSWLAVDYAYQVELGIHNRQDSPLLPKPDRMTDGTLILSLILPPISYMVLKATSLKCNLIVFSMSVLMNGFYIGRYDLYRSIPMYIIITFLSLFVLSEYHRQNWLAYIIRRKLTKLVEDNKRLAEEVKANELRHMIGNVAHDLKTVSFKNHPNLA